jgi:ABC-2 type transport system permease protein
MNLHRVLALTKKDLKKTIRQPAVLFLLLLFPLMITVVFSFAFGGIGGDNTTTFDVGLLNLDENEEYSKWSSNLIDNLSDLEVMNLYDYEDNETGQIDLQQGNIDAFIVIPRGFGASIESYWESPLNSSQWIYSIVGLYVDSGSLMATSAVPPLVNEAILKTIFGEQAITLQLPVEIGSPALIESSTLTQWDFMAPGIFAFSGIFLIMMVSETMVGERAEGLLKRLRTTPMKSSEFMVSQVLSNMVIATLQSLIVFTTAFAIGYRPATGPEGIIFAFSITTMFSLCSVGFGLIAATLSKNAEAATGISFIFIMPQMFLGTFMPLGGAAEVAGQAMPSNYVTHALTTLFLRGASITTTTIWVDFIIIAVMGILLVVAGIFLFEKYGSR